MLPTQSISDLKKNLKKDFSALPKVKLALLADSPSQLLNQTIRGYAYSLGWKAEVWEADFNQIERQIMDPQSELYESNAEFVVLFPSVQNLKKKFYALSKEEKKSFASYTVSHWQMLIETVQQKMKSLPDRQAGKIILLNYAADDDGVFGSFASKTQLSFTRQLREVNAGLDKLSLEIKNLFIADVHSLTAEAGKEKSFSASAYVNTGFVFHIGFFPRVAYEVCAVIGAIRGQLKKCLILDLDNTVWGGIVGDDGWENLQLGDLGIGKAYTQLQQWAKQLQQRGIILCVCSKNDEAIAKEAFEKHPDMVLKLDDIAVFVANWENKVDNIRFIQQVLNIGFDSMVFLDDNPFERNIVRMGIPELTVPELPEDAAEYLGYLQSLHLFETASLSEEDEARTQQYQEEAKRTLVQHTFANEEEYLASLKMIAEVSSFTKFNIPRVAQLTQRSNQFNLRTVRYTEEEIAAIASDKNFIGLSFSLSDKYGDYGLISVVILKKENDALFIDTWLMSCRVLKRGMEQFVTNQIVEEARRSGVKKILAEFLPTPKNGLVKNLLPDMGFVLMNDSKVLKQPTEETLREPWEMNVNDFTPHKNFIQLKEK